MKRSATEHDHRVNDVKQATNQVVFGVPCVLDVKWRLVNSCQMARGWDRPHTRDPYLHQHHHPLAAKL